jgi:hypothetical protein
MGGFSWVEILVIILIILGWIVASYSIGHSIGKNKDH